MVNSVQLEQTVALKCGMLLADTRKETRTGAAVRNQQIEREFRSKVEPVLNRAQVLITVDCRISHRQTRFNVMNSKIVL